MTGIMVFVMTLVIIFFWPFSLCYFADSATDRIKFIQRSVYDLNWYNFPLKQRKYFILILAQSQECVSFDGLYLVHCNLVTFGMVISELHNFIN